MGRLTFAFASVVEIAKLVKPSHYDFSLVCVCVCVRECVKVCIYVCVCVSASVRMYICPL